MYVATPFYNHHMKKSGYAFNYQLLSWQHLPHLKNILNKLLGQNKKNLKHWAKVGELPTKEKTTLSLPLTPPATTG
jgi:hypothetical protein